MIEPRAIDLVSPALLHIDWKDGTASDLAALVLRLACPCAQCVEEGSGRRVLRVETVPLDIRLLEAELVGRYGLSFRWSDGHATGIFTWPHLRKLGSTDGQGASGP